jgi:hypothetical protein
VAVDAGGVTVRLQASMQQVEWAGEVAAFTCLRHHLLQRCVISACTQYLTDFLCIHTEVGETSGSALR